MNDENDAVVLPVPKMVMLCVVVTNDRKWYSIKCLHNNENSCEEFSDFKFEGLFFGKRTVESC